MEIKKTFELTKEELIEILEKRFNIKIKKLSVHYKGINGEVE